MSEISTRKRGNLWEFRFEGASIGGKRKQISKSGFHTKKEAMLAGAKAFSEYNRSGLMFEPSSVSLSDYLDFWFEQDVKVNRKYNTQVMYNNFIRNHFKPALGKYRLSSLTPAILIQWINSYKDSPLAHNTIKHMKITLSVALDYAVEPLHLIPVNPMALIKTPKIGKKQAERTVLTDEDFEKILNRFPSSSRYHLIFQIGWNLGLRISEIMGLTWDDIDLENCTASINRQMLEKSCSMIGFNNKQKASVYLESLKSDASNRVVKFGKTLLDELTQAKIRQESYEKSYGDYYTVIIKAEGNRIEEIKKPDMKESDQRIRLVCIDENGEMITGNSMKYPINIIKQDLKIPIGFHSFRHTHATKLLDAGASLKAVQQRLGHKNLSTTYETYIHVTQKMEDDAVEIFEKINRKIR